MQSTAEQTITSLLSLDSELTVFTTFCISFTDASDVPPNFITIFKSVSPIFLVLKFFNFQRVEPSKSEFFLYLQP